MKNLFVKRLVCVALAVVLALGMAACAAPSQSESVSGSDTSNAGETSGAEREPVEIVWYNTINNKYPGEEAMLEAVNAYLKEKLNTTIDMHLYTAAEYADSVSTILQSGSYYDIVTVGTERVAFDSFASRNAFLPLNEYIDTYLAGTKKELSEFDWQCFTKDGNIYAVPAELYNVENWEFIMNKTMADDIGIEFPETYNTAYDLFDWLYEVKAARDAKYPEKAGQPIINKFGRFIEAHKTADILVGSKRKAFAVTNIPGTQGYSDIGDSDTVFCPIFSEDFREFAKKVRATVTDGIQPVDQANFDPDKVLYNSGELIGLVNIAVYYVSEEAGSYIPNNVAKLYSAGDATLNTNNLSTCAFSINAECNYPERALEVLELCQTDTYLATLLRFGPEGDGWTDVDNDNVVEYGPMNQDTANPWFVYFNGFSMGGMGITKVKPGLPGDWVEIIKDKFETASVSPNLGFVFDPTPVQNEIAACSNVWDEYYEIFTFGKTDDIDNMLEEFRTKLKANGIDTILAECQKQLDDWKKANGK